MAHYSQDLLCTIDHQGNFLQVSEASSTLLGYQSTEMCGQHFSGFVLEEDLPITQEAINDVFAGHNRTNLEIRLIHRTGQTLYFLWSGAWSAEDQVIYAIGRDVTELRISRKNLEESEQRYKALFEHNPDVIFLENTEGLVTEVNQSFCDAWRISRDKAINRPASAFLPPHLISVAEQSFKEALLGSMLRCDLEFECESGQRRVFDTTKYPIWVNGQIVGVQTVAKDITPMVLSYETIQHQAHKLNTILESITDAFLTLSKDWQITYINSEAENLLALDRRQHIGLSFWNLLPEEMGSEIYLQLLQALETDSTVDFTSFLKTHSKWLRVKAYPSEEGLSIYIDDVTQQVKAQQELERLSLVARHTTNGVVITGNSNTIEWVNEGFTKLTGYTLEEAVNRTPVELLKGEETNASTIQRIYDGIEKPEAFREEILVYGKTGQKRWLDVELTPVLNEKQELTKRIRILSDITDRKATQKELEKLSLVASRTNNSVLIADKNWHIEWINNGFTRLFGYSPEEAIGKKPSDLLHSTRTDKTAFAALEQNLLRGEAISFEVLNLKKSGEEVWLSVEVSPVLDEHGNIIRFVEVQTDITPLKTSERELAKLAKDLYRQNSDLQQFTYIISHNLRSPVANAMGLADLLLNTAADKTKFEKTLDFLRQSIYKLDTVLKDVNTILSIRDKKGNLERELVNLNDVVSQAMSSFFVTLQKEGAKVNISIPDGLTLKANKAYVYSVFYNLISNAIKYRSQERPLQVDLNCFGDEQKGIIISFSDNGSGFDAQKEKKNLFKLYKRFHPKQEGRGMGLYLVKNHIEAMGGRIEVSSKVGIGTSFLIHLPQE